MSKSISRTASAMLSASAAIVALALATPGHAQSNAPIKIGVIAEAQAVAGSSIPQAAQLAADEINAAGGVNGRKIEIVTYDDHSSAAEAVRAFQRAANEDHVNAVIASYISEVVLALEPWTGRLKTPMITPGAASDVITQEHRQGLRSPQIYVPRLSRPRPASPTPLCDAVKDLLIKGPAHEDRRGDERGRRLDHAARRRIPELPADRSGSRCSTTSASRPTPPTSRRSSTRSRARSPT